MKDLDKYNRIMEEANKAKAELSKVVEKLYKEGFERKAASGLSLVWKIEQWQNTKP